MCQESGHQNAVHGVQKSPDGMRSAVRQRTSGGGMTTAPVKLSMKPVNSDKGSPERAGAGKSIQKFTEDRLRRFSTSPHASPENRHKPSNSRI
ncbi:MAG: hypothetical protein E7496_12260 [Ruminococcus sp.]|nr:hypothetical protein [Ruminococcus sp.]